MMKRASSPQLSTDPAELETKRQKTDHTPEVEPFVSEEDQVTKELELLELGQHPDYLARVKHLQEEREFREWMIDQWKTYSVNCCDAIVEHGKEEFNSKLHNLEIEIKENLVKECTEQRKKLEETTDQPQRPDQQRPVTRKLLRSRRKDESFLDDTFFQISCVNEITMLMKLNEREVKEDLAAIQRAIRGQQQ